MKLRFLRKFLPVLAGLVLIGWLWAQRSIVLAPDLTDLPALPRFNAKLKLNDADRTAVAQAVRNALADPEATFRPPPGLPTVKTQIFVSLYPPGEAPAFYRSTGIDPLPAALADAVKRMRADTRTMERLSNRAAEVAIRVDALRWLRKLPAHASLRKIPIEAGLDGLILQKKDELVHQPPWDIVTSDWEVGEGYGRTVKRKTRQLRLLSKAAGRGPKGWRNANLYRYRTVAFIQDADGQPARRLYRNLVVNNETPTRRELAAALDAAADFVVRKTSDEGKFTYLYHPMRDATNFPLNYGVVRHAGAVYGLFAVAKERKTPSVHDAAERALAFMKDMTRPPAFHRDERAIGNYGLSLLGTSALGLVALLEKPAETRTPEETDTARRLADFLVNMQVPDGRFYGAYWQRLLGRVPDPPPLYFPGESFLALVRYAKETGEARYL
ncbi:hypothetical protein KDL45_03740, partial [bacterium]|nr:hypothetical protein [bacterium]